VCTVRSSSSASRFGRAASQSKEHYHGRVKSRGSRLRRLRVAPACVSIPARASFRPVKVRSPQPPVGRPSDRKGRTSSTRRAQKSKRPDHLLERAIVRTSRLNLAGDKPKDRRALVALPFGRLRLGFASVGPVQEVRLGGGGDGRVGASFSSMEGSSLLRRGHDHHGSLAPLGEPSLRSDGLCSLYLGRRRRSGDLFCPSLGPLWDLAPLRTFSELQQQHEEALSSYED
jgi:hypothetical protein